MSYRSGKVRARACVVGAAVATSALLGGCAEVATPELLLAGPTTDITVAIPAGWHQVINSASPALPQMLAPTTCMGAKEVGCATALARIATFPSRDAQSAEELVEKAVVSGPGDKAGASVSQGPARVGEHDGYRHRFGFTHPGANLTAEIAAFQSGAAAPDAQGNRLFSVVLVWVSDKPDAPKLDVIDEIINSAKVAANQPPTAR